MFKTWAKTKAMESCWGEDNMKQYTVNIKKAIAKCNQVDAPELDLPPYRSVDRFVNVMLTFANDMESNQFEQLYKMMSIINEEHYERKRPYHRRYHSKPYMRDYDQDMYNYDMDQKMDKFKMMPYGDMESRYYNKFGSTENMDMEKFQKMYETVNDMKMKSNEKQFAAARSSMPMYDSPSMRSSVDMSDFETMWNNMKSFRHKRQANDDALALNDRLKEKIQHVFEEQQSKVENMTCVLREMNCLNAENEIDIRAMKKDAEQYNMPSAWFKNRYEEILDTCYEMATNLPESLDKQGIVTGDFGTVNMGRIKSFMGCCKNAKQNFA